MKFKSSKPQLDDLREHEGLAKSLSKKPQSAHIVHEKPRKKRWSVFRIVALSIVVLIIAGAGFFAYKFVTLGSQVIDSEKDRSVFDQLRLLVNSDSEKLRGEAEGRINILLLGMGGEGHPGGNLTDSIMLASIDTQSNKVALLSLPRDLYVDLPGGGKGKINSAHAFAEEAKPGSGPDAIEQVIKDVTGQTVHYYVRIDFQGFKKMIDDVGGVDVPIETTFYDYLHDVKFSEGIDHMDGARALIYSRGRYITPASLGGDFERTKKQQQVLVALRDKVLSTGTLANPDTINKILNDLGKHVRTNAEIWEMKRLFDIAKEVDKDEIIHHVVEGGPDGLVYGDSVILGGLRASVQIPKAGDFHEIQDLAEHIFDAEYVPESATIEVQNGSGVAGVAAKAAKEITFEVKKIGNAKSSDYTATVIYDYSDGKNPNTLKELETLFGVKATTPPSVAKNLRQSTADILVIVGDDYASK